MGFSVLGIRPIFGSVFRFSYLKSAVFRFWFLAQFASFVKNDSGFRNFLPNAFCGFSGFAKEIATGNQKATSECGQRFCLTKTTYNYFIVIYCDCDYCNFSSHCYRSEEPIYKNIKQMFRLRRVLT